MAAARIACKRPSVPLAPGTHRPRQLSDSGFPGVHYCGRAHRADPRRWQPRARRSVDAPATDWCPYICYGRIELWRAEDTCSKRSRAPDPGGHGGGWRVAVCRGALSLMPYGNLVGLRVQHSGLEGGGCFCPGNVSTQPCSPSTAWLEGGLCWPKKVCVVTSVFGLPLIAVGVLPSVVFWFAHW